MPAASVKVLLISPGPREEFVQPLAELRRAADVFECETPREAAEYLREASCPPTLILIAQSRPGEYARAELDRLVELAPLARFVLLLGSWCEGETRTGHIWPVATRVFWYEWPGEVARNLPAISHGQFAPWLAPATTLEEERFLFGSFEKSPCATPPACPQTGVSNARAPLILVITRRSSYGEALCAACWQQGYSALWQRPDRPERIPGVGAILWEGVQVLPAEVAELEALALLWPRTPILALADFPRLETQERAISAGAVAVLAKPFTLADLLSQLNRFCPLPRTEGKTAQTEVA